MDPVGKSQTSQWSVCANKQQKNQIIQESRSSIDERSFCLSLSRICLAIYQLYALAFEHVRDASLWAHVCASTLRRYVWVCAIHSVGFTPLMQSGTRVPKSLSHDSPIVWVWAWWGSLWAECTVMRCSPAPGRERGEGERYAAEVKWLKWDYRRDLTCAVYPMISLRSVIKENTSLQSFIITKKHLHWLSICRLSVHSVFFKVHLFVILQTRSCTKKWKSSSLNVTQSSEDELKSIFFLT